MIYQILISVVILIFPIIVYLFYCTYNNNLNKEQSKLFLDISILSSLYLLVIYDSKFIIFYNIPLIFAFMKKRTFVSIIITTIILFSLNFSVINIVEYIIYFIIYFFYKKNILCLFLIIKFIFNNNFLTSILFIIVTYLVLFLYKKGEDIIKLHMNIKELEKEKQLRSSLFKITHEIKNPIAVCKSYLDMFDINNKDHVRYIGILKEEMDKILLLLQDFLSMNKIKIEKEILDINFLLEDIVNQFEPILKDKNIKFIYNICEDEIFVEGDYNRLNQVFINIIKNSIEAINDKGVIKLDYEIDKNFKIIIEDNGCGITEEQIEKIKEPFYTTKKNGTGLGVSLSIEIIKAHNGKIDYIPLKKGLKVIVELPVHELTSFNIN